MQVTSPQVYTKKGVPISVVDTAQVKTNVHLRVISGFLQFSWRPPPRPAYGQNDGNRSYGVTVDLMALLDILWC